MIIDAILSAVSALLSDLMTFFPVLPVFILAQFLFYLIQWTGWFVSACAPLTYYIPIGFAVQLGIARIEFEVGYIIWNFVRWILGHLPTIGGGE